MCTRTQDRQGTPARSALRTSLVKIQATCVDADVDVRSKQPYHIDVDARIGYIQNVLVFETLRIIVEAMTGSVGRYHSHVHLPHRLVPPTHTHHVCYADDITVWDSGPKFPQLEYMINSYLRDVGIYLKENSL